MSFDLQPPDGGPWRELFQWLGFTWLLGMRISSDIPRAKDQRPLLPQERTFLTQNVVRPFQRLLLG